jgi:sec-independent protein translocase protein TatA
MGTVGLWGVVAIVAVIVLLYGAKRLPDMARSLGRSSREFKDALVEAPDEFRDGLKDGDVDDPETLPAAPTARELELERELEAERARRSQTSTSSGRDT